MALRVSAQPFTLVSHVLAIAAAIMVLVWCIHFRGGLAFEATNKSLIFNIHPVLMLIGFIILGGEAIISYKALPWRKEVKKLIHLILHLFALILGIVGIYAAFKYHNESNIANLYSLHSWIGIGTICLYGIQLTLLHYKQPGILWIQSFISFCVLIMFRCLKLTVDIWVLSVFLPGRLSSG
uniref:Cytochrome b561 domain-containing protein n=1 Tax=Nelumbo nucifera TaxID=4432 RepID=A0A822XG37_NELNU|nr:TPA_asm: hypothetical protein HUJ06_020335 [Nelumbo nucifera]